MSRALVAGWFSFEGMGASAGDLMVRDLCSQWLSSAGWHVDQAVIPSLGRGVDWRTCDASQYDLVVFACGPFGNGWPVTEFLERFSGTKLVGLNLSMLESVEDWDPFDVLIERDSSRTRRPDVSILSAPPSRPLVGVVLVHPQAEYEGAMHEVANAAVDRLISMREVVAVPIDTQLEQNSGRLTSAQQIEALIARMDAVVTTRLHGTVLAIKNGVAPVVIDPIAGGRKVMAQARSLGWPKAYAADELDEVELASALDFCLGPSGHREALRARARGVAGANEARDLFIQSVSVGA
jgi:hypothetical protein